MGSTIGPVRGQPGESIRVVTFSETKGGTVRSSGLGTMRLRQVRNTEKRRVTVIEVSIRSTGAGLRPDGSESDAAVNLSDEVPVNLDTMLDEAPELKGTITSTYIKGAESITSKFPIRMLATKTFVKDSPLP